VRKDEEKKCTRRSGRIMSWREEEVWDKVKLNEKESAATA